jgi:rubrerythrin
MNAIEYMIAFEEDGLHLYELLAFTSTNDELRTTFNLLADSQSGASSAICSRCNERGCIYETERV